MVHNPKNSLFTELSSQEEAQTNGGRFVQISLGTVLGGLGSAWWARNFWGNISRGNLNGAFAVTDRYILGLTNSLRRFGIF